MIEKGQVYRSVKPDTYGVHTRIQVISAPGFGAPGGYGTVTIATIAASGKLIRQRPIQRRELHADILTMYGKPRRNGYVLVQEEEL